MADNGNRILTTRQKRTITALMLAPDIRSAAEQAKVGYRSVMRWLDDPLFMAELQQAEAQLINDGVRELVQDFKNNQGIMRSIRDNGRNSASVRLRAANLLDKSLLSWRGFMNYEKRLADLEAAVYEKS